MWLVCCSVLVSAGGAAACGIAQGLATLPVAAAMVWGTQSLKMVGPAEGKAAAKAGKVQRREEARQRDQSRVAFGRQEVHSARLRRAARARRRAEGGCVKACGMAVACTWPLLVAAAAVAGVVGAAAAARTAMTLVGASSSRSALRPVTHGRRERRSDRPAFGSNCVLHAASSERLPILLDLAFRSTLCSLEPVIRMR